MKLTMLYSLIEHLLLSSVKYISLHALDRALICQSSSSAKYTKMFQIAISLETLYEKLGLISPFGTANDEDVPILC